MLYQTLVETTNKGRAQSGLKKDGVFTSYPKWPSALAASLRV